VTGAVKLYYSIVPGQLTESRDVNTQLATPGVSFVGADDAFAVVVSGQSSVEINVILIDDGVPRPTQVFLVNLTRVDLLSARTANFAPRLGELITSTTTTSVAVLSGFLPQCFCSLQWVSVGLQTESLGITSNRDFYRLSELSVAQSTGSRY